MKEKKSRDPTGRQRLSPQRHAVAMPVLKLIINKHTWSPRMDAPEMFRGPCGNTVMQQGEREEEREGSENWKNLTGSLAEQMQWKQKKN